MQTALKWLALVGKVAGAATSLSAYVNVIPEKYQFIGLLVIGGASILKDVVNRVADLIDDGKLNDSINKPVA